MILFEIARLLTVLIFTTVVHSDYPDEELSETGTSIEIPSEPLEEIHIGGLFESLDSTGATAFELAVNYVNDKGLIPGKKLIADVIEVSESDSFEVGKTVCRLLSSGVVGVLGPGSQLTAHHVQSICDTNELPHITTRWDLFQKRSSCLVNLYPHPSALSQALKDIVEAWEWKGFTVIYDDYDALRKVHSLLKLADDKGYLVALRQLDAEDGNYRPILKEIKHSEERNIVLECSNQILPEVLLQAQQVGLMGGGYNYIISSMDFHTIDYSPFMWAGTNITSIRIVNPENPYVQEIAAIWAENANEENGTSDNSDVDTTEAGDYQDKEDEENGNEEEEYKRRRKRQEPEADDYENQDNGIDEEEGNGTSEPDLVFGSTSEMPPTEQPPTELPIPTVEAALIHDGVLLFAKAMEHLDTLSFKPTTCEDRSSLEFGYSVINFMKLTELEGMSGLIKFDHEGFRTEVEIEILELTEEGLKKKGTWNQTLHLIYPDGTEIPEDPGEDLRNATFIVLISLIRPYNMLKEDKNALTGNDRYEGFGIDLIHELSLMSGFNYTFKEDVLKSSGNPTELPNGSRVWSGMIGEVQAGRADLAIADITITQERERDADFTMPFMNLGISILYRKPTKAPPELFSFLSPFSPEVWAYMISAYVGVSLLFFVMARISPAEWTNPYPCIEEPEALENQFSLINSFWFTVGSLMQQGSDVAPIGVSTRMAASIWWFFTLIMVSSYTANLAAFLTIENPEIIFKDVEGLVKLKDMKYGARINGSTHNFFRDSIDPTHKKVYEFMQKNVDCMMGSNDAGVQRVLREKNYAFFMESTGIEYEVERNCDLYQVGKLLDNKGYGIVMKQNSSYRNVLSKNVVKLQEKGKLTQLKNKWWKEKRGGGACSSEKEAADASELNLANVGGVYVVLLGGCLFSILITAFELLWDIYTRDDKVSFKEELKKELKFIIRCRGTVKPVTKPDKDGASGSRSSSSSSKKSSFG